MEPQAGTVRRDPDGLLLPKESGVALCFKVPLSFRRWFKLQALSRDLTMTEFLIKAAKPYAATAEVTCQGAQQRVRE